MSKVSVIIPVYNGEKYLKQCIDSLLVQTLQDIEVICVDDGSTDDSLNILHQYCKMDTRVQVIQQENQHAGVARNRGLDIAKGKYLLFLDADDYFTSNMIEEMYKEAEQNSLDIVICQYDVYNEKSKTEEIRSFETEESFLPNKSVFYGNEVKERAIFQLTTGVAWNKMFKAEFVRTSGIRFQNLRSSNDGFFTYCLLAIAGRIGYIKRSFVKYRMGNKESLSNTREKSWENAFTMLKAIKNELINRGCYSCYEKTFLNYALTHGVGYLESINTYMNFEECFYRIRELEKEEFHLLEQPEDFFYNQSIWYWYKKVNCLQLNEYLFEKMMQKKSLLLNNMEHKWIVPYEKMEKNKSIAIYGAGKVGRSYYKQLWDSGFSKRIIWVDKNYKKIIEKGYQVCDPMQLIYENVDYIIIAIANDETKCKVLEWLIGIGINQEKIIE